MADEIYEDVDEWEDWEDWEDETEGMRVFKLRKIVAFELGDELYGADIDEVAEIMEMAPLMPLPNVPEFILGLINLRGEIVPVIDLRVKFQLDQKPWSLDSRIIVMQTEKMLVGVVVDRMWELLRLPEEAFQPPPPDVAKIDSEFFQEVSEVNDRMLIVLDIKKILMRTART